MKLLQHTLLLRRSVQIAFTLTTLLIGVQFYLFVRSLETGAEKIVSRPPGVEAFLPISSLMSLKYWLLSGDFPMVHPSGLLLLLVILTTALLLKRGFCSWVCPFGLLSEYLAKIHIRLFDRPRRVWQWLDYPLRSLKYLLLLFFLWAIFVQMNLQAIEAFLASPYNKVADIKMLKFFTHASPLTIYVLTCLVLLSVLVRHFWCRYLCPYGALLAALSWISPWKIRRNAETCINCEKCTAACPANITVHKVLTVRSDECHACYACVATCPIEGTLSLSAPKRTASIRPVVFAGLIVGLFLLTSIGARLAGIWQTNILLEEYRYHILYINFYDHPGSSPGSNRSF